MEGRLERELSVRGYELNARGQVSPATLLRYLEHLRWEAIRTIPAVSQLFSDGRFTVVRAQRLEVIAELGVTDRVTGAVWAGKLGRSSVELRHELRLPSGEPVARAAVVGVHVDAAGKPHPLPEELRATAVDRGDWVPSPTGAGAEVAPPDAFQERLRVRPSHLDSFQHVNHAVWVDWLDDHRQVGAAAGGYGEASPLAGGRLHRLFIDYRQEAVLGDELTLRSWLLPAGGVSCEVRRGQEPEPLCTARLEVDAA